ncbi:ADP-ribosylation factor-like protein 6-like protein [Paraphysoderma sedebokerense]|nr:ADP-ribosylation factor-like protein 6-like protein [Paraphysoderma sedebokerense]
MKFISKFLSSLGILRKQVNVLLIGLDNSGKSTIANWFKLQKTPDASAVPPTVGFKVERFNHASHNLSFTVFDMSGQDRYRDMWELYFDEADAIIFVIDLSDAERFKAASDEFAGVITHDAVKSRSIPILVLANKSDLPNVMSLVQVSKDMGLDSLRENNWHFCPCCALYGEGLPNGLDWLSDQLSR